MLEDVLTRFWENLISRPTGPMKFRFVLQPAMAIFLAVRAGLHDYREGRPPYFWSVCAEPAERRKLMREGWESVGRVFILALVLDCVYQFIVLRWIYPGEAIAVGIVLAIIPYVLVRGPVNRILSLRKRDARKSTKGKEAA